MTPSDLLLVPAYVPLPIYVKLRTFVIFFTTEPTERTERGNLIITIIGVSIKEPLCALCGEKITLKLKANFHLIKYTFLFASANKKKHCFLA
jgi:hypothetical protein